MLQKFIFLSFLLITTACIGQVKTHYNDKSFMTGKGKQNKNYQASVLNINPPETKFILKGQIKNVKHGKVYLIPTDISQKYYGEKLIIDSSVIEQEKFSIQKQFFNQEAYPYRILVKSSNVNGFTDLVFIAPRNQEIIVDTLHENIAPKIRSSKEQSDMRYEYNPFFRNLVLEVSNLDELTDEMYAKYGDSLPIDVSFKLNFLKNKIIAKSDSLFAAYADTHPDSYVTLWKLIERFFSMGYKKEYEGFYNTLSARLKNSLTGKLFRIDLNNAAILALTNRLPILQLEDTNKRNIKFGLSDYGYKFTLVDFWFSGCAPCIAQFETLKRLQVDFRSFGFEIVGVSIDSRKDSEAWKTMIKDRELNWTHYLDVDGRLAQKLGINFFPTNLLLDFKGKIIARNISLSRLETFIMEQIKMDKINYNAEGIEPH